MPVSLNGQRFYKTAEACALAGTTRSTFLRWVREGIFADVETRDRNGWRLFTEDDIHRLQARVHSVSRFLPNRTSLQYALTWWCL
jgi:predicted site-specific integrase-resolvase